MGSEGRGIAGRASRRKGRGARVNPASKKSPAAKLNPMASALFCWLEERLSARRGRLLDTETRALVQRWIIAFCETPVLIDKELMRRMLADVEKPSQDVTPWRKT